VKGNPVPAFFYALGGFTFLKFVIKTLVVFSETFILPGTNVSVAACVCTAVTHVSAISSKSSEQEREVGLVGRRDFLCICDADLLISVVTGASDGIGREYSIQLAKKGFNVLVVARNETALKSVTDEIG